jgi:hypothetical protein
MRVCLIASFFIVVFFKKMHLISIKCLSYCEFVSNPWISQAQDLGVHDPTSGYHRLNLSTIP